MMTVMYGGPPLINPDGGRTTPWEPITTDKVFIDAIKMIAPGEAVEIEPQKLTVTARVDEDGNVCLLISVNGVKKAEVKGGNTAMVTVDL